MKLPKNVWLFQVLLYSSLALDALSAAFQDRTPTPEMTSSTMALGMLIPVGVILLLVYFVELAAQHRKNWPRWVLAAMFAVSVVTLIQIIGSGGLEFASGIEIVSCALTAAGLYFSFTGDAQGWFNA
jgi:hypothetical protein